MGSCSAAGHDPALINALEGSTNWIFGYTSDIGFLGSIQLETAILSAVLKAESSYTESDDKIVAAFAKALGCFNPEWKIWDAPTPALWQSVRLMTRAKHKKNPTDCTEALVEEAWPGWKLP